MKIRRKVSLIVTLTMVGCVAAILATARLLLIDRFAQLEEREVRLNVQRAANALSEDLAGLSRTIEDYAAWDQTYVYMATRNARYTEEEMSAATLAGLGVNYLAILDVNGREVFSRSIDLASKKEVAAPEGVAPYLRPEGPLLSRPGTAGIVLLPHGPMRIGSFPILTAQRTGPTRGTLVMGRWLNESEVSSLARRTQLSLSIEPVSRQRAARSGETIVRALSPDLVAGYLPIGGLTGKPVLVLCVQMPRVIYAQSRVTLEYLILCFVAAGLVFGLVTDLLLHRIVLSRLERLTKSVAAIGVEQRFSERVSLPGNDELAMLALSINGTLGSLEQAEAALANILRSMDEALIVTDPELRIRRVNPRTLRLLGYREEQLIGQHAGMVTAEQAAPGEATGVERTFRTRSGEYVPVLFSSAELRDSSGKLEGYVWLAQDVTELKRVQEEIVRARDLAEQANRAKSTFLANMSHELRTPLNAIIGYSEMLQEDCGSEVPEHVRPDLMKIERSGHMLLAIINDLLDLSKIEAGRMELSLETFDVLDILRDVQNAVHPLALQRGNQMEVSCEDAALQAFGDAAKFRQSLLNLVNNACKFTENGRVGISVRKVSRDRLAQVEVQVSDNGIGIPPEHLNKLFQPFSQVDPSATRKYGGTGLGLAISRKFCQMMGGDITVESEQGRGSRFFLRIPASRVAPR
jgi:PAS domain S-box-containing protein